MAESHLELVERLYGAFNRRDPEADRRDLR